MFNINVPGKAMGKGGRAFPVKALASSLSSGYLVLLSF
jgi:hypothetical protein